MFFSLFLVLIPIPIELICVLFWADVSLSCIGVKRQPSAANSSGPGAIKASRSSTQSSGHEGHVVASQGQAAPVASLHRTVGRLFDTTGLSVEVSSESELLRADLGKYSCMNCGKLFSFPGNRLRHEKMCQQVSLVPCPVCHQAFARSDNLKTHIRQVHGIGEQLVCSLCGKKFRSKIRLDEHRTQCEVTSSEKVHVHGQHAASKAT